VAVLLSPVLAVAELPAPIALAVLLSPPLALAKLFAPTAIAEDVSVALTALQDALPLLTRSVPLMFTQTFGAAVAVCAPSASTPATAAPTTIADRFLIYFPLIPGFCRSIPGWAIR